MASSVRPGASTEAEAWLRRKLVSNRNYWPYWAGNVASWGGLGLADVLLLFLVYTSTGSALAVAYVGIAASIPVVAVGLPVGVLVDRVDRRMLLIITGFLQAGILAIVPISLALVGFQLDVVLILVFLLETATAVFRPSATSILPSLVSSATLDDANGLLQASTAVASTVGAGTAPVLLAAGGIYASFAFCGVVFLLSGFVMTRIHSPVTGPLTHPGGLRRPSVMGDLRAAFQYLFAHRALLELTLVSVALGFFLALSTPFLVVYTVNVLAAPAAAFGYLVAGFSGGFLVGSVSMGRLGIVRRFGWTLIATLLTGGALYGILALVPMFDVAGVALVTLGVMFGLITTAFFSLVQRIVPAGLLGRYLSIDETIGLAMTPVGILAGGLLTDFYGVRLAFAVAAVGLGATGVIAYFLQDLRGLHFDAPPEPIAVPRTALLGTRADELPAELPTGETVPQPPPVRDEVWP